MKHLAALLFGLALVAVGAVGGYLARFGFEVEHDAEAAAAADEHEDEELDPATLDNLGVQFGELKAGSYTATRVVHGVVGDPGLGQRPLSSPFAGIVREIAAAPGQVIGAGETLVEVLRDDLPLPELTTTSDMLAPLDEELHRLYLELRRTARARDLAKAESERLTGLAGDELRLVSAEQRITAERALALAEQDFQNVRGELHVHGFSEEQIDGIQQGGHPVRDQEVRIRSLRTHGLWDEGVEEVFALLPDEVRAQAWTVAALGELQAQGLWSRALRQALAEVPELRERFRETVSLLLSGSSVERLRTLAATGGIGPVIRVAAPTDAGDWDVTEILARPGQRVAVGEPLVRLDRPASMWLIVQPVGDEVAALQNALEAHAELEARPLVQGAGPVMTGLRLQRVTTEDRGLRPGSVAYVRVDNRALPGGEGGRSWALRPGTRYALRLPVRTFENVFVLPRGAVTSRGPDRVAFESHPGHMHVEPVRVLYEDEEVVVLPVEGSPFKVGDTVVIEGAFALAQAMQLEGGGGHDHAHPH